MSPVFDHSGSLQRMGSDQQLFQDMVGFLQEDAPRLLQRYRQGLADRQPTTTEHAAHTLKGLISNFGAARATAAAAQAEHFGRQGDWAAAERIISELESALDELQQALAPYAPQGVKQH